MIKFLIDIITVVALANLITNQTIGRNFVGLFFKTERRLYFTGLNKFIFSILTCSSCLSVWIGVIYSLIIGYDPISSIQIGLISMLISWAIEKR